jgi:nitrate/TMAO reductase-like tetraheme cytochrome c subunit
MRDVKQHAEYTRLWRLRNKERLALYEKSRRLKVIIRSRNHSLKKLYGITQSEYELLFESQNGECAICHVHQNDLKVRLAVDHCHETNRIRGLLCRSCNTAIGHLRDDVNILQSAIKYLS